MKVKSILRRDDKLYYKNFTVGFNMYVTYHDPVPLPPPQRLTAMQYLLESDCPKNVNAQQVEDAARVLQRFARRYMICWLLANEQRTDVFEEVVRIEEKKQMDLQSLEWEMEDRRRRALLEIQEEQMREQIRKQTELAEQALLGITPEPEPLLPYDYKEVKDNIAIMEGLHKEVRVLKTKNKKVKKDCKNLKKRNKQLLYDLKEHNMDATKAKFVFDCASENHDIIKTNHDQFPSNVELWKDGISTTETNLHIVRQDGHTYRDTCLKILTKVLEQYPRRRVLKPVLKILYENLVQNQLIPDIFGEEYKNSKKSSSSSSGGRKSSPNGRSASRSRRRSSANAISSEVIKKVMPSLRRACSFLNVKVAGQELPSLLPEGAPLTRAKNVDPKKCKLTKSSSMSSLASVLRTHAKPQRKRAVLGVKTLPKNNNRRASSSNVINGNGPLGLAPKSRRASSNIVISDRKPLRRAASQANLRPSSLQATPEEERLIPTEIVIDFHNWETFRQSMKASPAKNKHSSFGGNDKNKHSSFGGGNKGKRGASKKKVADAPNGKTNRRESFDWTNYNPESFSRSAHQSLDLGGGSSCGEGYDWTLHASQRQLQPIAQ